MDLNHVNALSIKTQSKTERYILKQKFTPIKYYNDRPNISDYAVEIMIYNYKTITKQSYECY
jgi:hypothetical protein